MRPDCHRQHAGYLGDRQVLRCHQQCDGAGQRRPRLSRPGRAGDRQWYHPDDQRAYQSAAPADLTYTGTGVAVFGNTNYQTWVYPEWTGAGVGVAAAANLDNINNAILLFPAGGSGALDFAGGIYDIDDQIVTAGRHLWFKGAGTYATIIKQATAASLIHGIRVTGTSKLLRITDLSINMASALTVDNGQKPSLSMRTMPATGPARPALSSMFTMLTAMASTSASMPMGRRPSDLPGKRPLLYDSMYVDWLRHSRQQSSRTQQLPHRYHRLQHSGL